MNGLKNITTVFFGDGAVEEGVFHESMNFASLKQLPIVFICENNFFSVYSPLSVRQPTGREIFELAKSHGIVSMHGDGNNVLEVYHLMTTAIKIIKGKNGPVFIELKTYRWREHCGPYYDNNLGYRKEEESNEWKNRCPIESYSQFLVAKGYCTHDDVKMMKNQILQNIRQAFDFARESPFPSEKQLMENVYRD